MNIYTDFVKTIFKTIRWFLATILLISTVQWVCMQFLATFCSKWSFIGIFQNLLSLGSPMCSFVNHVQIGLADYYITIWAVSATSFITYIGTMFSIKKI